MLVREHFLVQYRILNRWLGESGIRPVIGWPLAAILFVLLSLLLFSRSGSAVWVYLLAGVGTLSLLNRPGRAGFLRSLFLPKEYATVRTMENLVAVLPFVFFLLIQKQPWAAAGLFFVAPVLALIPPGRSWTFVLPTPFGRWPFEFAAGFRQAWLLILISLWLALMGWFSDNSNLVFFAQGMLLLTACGFYLQPESDYYVWIFNRRPAGFLVRKVGTAAVYGFLLTLPVQLILLITRPSDIGLSLALQGIGTIYLTAVILAKYASFPRQISIPWMILLVMCLVFPPLLPVLLPWLWFRAVAKGREVLE